jgi:hypothetical protein
VPLRQGCFVPVPPRTFDVCCVTHDFFFEVLKIACFSWYPASLDAKKRSHASVTIRQKIRSFASSGVPENPWVCRLRTFPHEFVFPRSRDILELGLVFHCWRIKAAKNCHVNRNNGKFFAFLAPPFALLSLHDNKGQAKGEGKNESDGREPPMAR